MATAFYSTVLDHPTGAVWSMIRDFNNYPVYIEGVSESVIEDERRGDEVGAVRRFCYRGLWVRQRLVRHSDAERLLSYAGLERLPFPPDRLATPPSPAAYEGTMQLQPITDSDRTFLAWSVDLDAAPGEEAPWQALFEEWIPKWGDSLRRTLAR